MAGGAPDHIPESCKGLGFGALCAYSETLALLFLGFVVMVVAISLSLHSIEHWIDHRFGQSIATRGLGRALKEAMARVKEEFMITGMIALLLFSFGKKLEGATCYEFEDGGYGKDAGYENKGDAIGAGHDYLAGRRRSLLAAEKACKQATMPFLEQEYAHILLLMSAIVNVVYSVLTIVITTKRIAAWRGFETAIQQQEMQPLSSRGIRAITGGRIRGLISCTFRQFYLPFVWPGVDKDAYMSGHYAAVEWWRPMIYRQMLLKAQDVASFALESRILILLQPKVEQAEADPYDKSVADELLGVAQRFRDESFLLSAAALEKADIVQLRKHRFAALYRIKVREFKFINLLQMLGAEQFAEDRIMAFLMPTIIGLALLFPHSFRLFAWFPPLVWLVLVCIGFELQRVLFSLKRRYHTRYVMEYPEIVRRHAIRVRFCRAYAAWRLQENKGPAKVLTSHHLPGPQIPDILQEEKVQMRLAKRTLDHYRHERYQSTDALLLPVGVILRIFVFCFYCNGFFLAMVIYTFLIKTEEFVYVPPQIVEHHQHVHMLRYQQY